MGERIHPIAAGKNEIYPIVAWGIEISLCRKGDRTFSSIFIPLHQFMECARKDQAQNRYDWVYGGSAFGLAIYKWEGVVIINITNTPMKGNGV